MKMKTQPNELSKFIHQAKEMLFSYYISETNDNKTFSYSKQNESDSTSAQGNNKPNLQVMLSEMYERIVPLDFRKDHGQFFTKERKIIGLMVNESDIMGGKILEPACGTGLFLIEIIKSMEKELEKRSFSAEQKIAYISENVYGIDVDERALQIAELNLLTEMMPLLIEAKKNNPEYEIPKFNLIRKDFINKDSICGGFNLIIGNPPFITMYGKRSRNMSEEKRAYYNTFDFVQNKKGNNKFNSAMFFVENGLKCLNNDGCLFYVLDISFFETAYIDLRKYIVQNYYIETIIKNLQEFENVASGQVLVKIRNRHSYNSKVLFKNYGTGETVLVDQKTWDDEKTKYKYYIPLSGINKDINNKVNQYKKLGDLFPKKALRTCCALTGRTEDFVVEQNAKIPFTIYPYIEGSKGLSQKFGHLKETRYIKYDYNLQLQISDEFKEELTKAGVKNKKRVTLGDNEMYDAPKLFIRQSASEVIATYTEKPYAANNSIYILCNKDYSKKGKELLKYVCGIVNSDLVTYYCRTNGIIRMEKGKTPQIKTSDFKEVRIAINTSYYKEVIRIVDELLINPNNLNSKKKLNDIVYKIYAITPEEQQIVSNNIAKNNL